jgi:septum formation inhibitor-activating ATPase MinD
VLFALASVCRDADRVAGLLEANNIYNTKLLVNRVRPDMIQKNDMMSVRDVQVGTAASTSTVGPAATGNACRCIRLQAQQL